MTSPLFPRPPLAFSLFPCQMKLVVAFWSVRAPTLELFFCCCSEMNAGQRGCHPTPHHTISPVMRLRLRRRRGSNSSITTSLILQFYQTTAHMFLYTFLNLATAALFTVWRGRKRGSDEVSDEPGLKPAPPGSIWVWLPAPPLSHPVTCFYFSSY